MKKFSMFLKRTILVVLPALLAGSLSLGQLHDVKPVSAEDSSVSSAYDVENDIYTIRKTGEHSIELLFNANPKVYKNFRKSHLNELKNSLMEILKDIVHTKITDLSKNEVDPDTEEVDGEGGDYQDIPEAAYTGGGEFSETLVHNVSDYVSLMTYANMLTNYCSINEDGSIGSPVLTRITSTVVNAYAHYWVSGQILRNGWDESERANVYHDFCVILAIRLHSPFGVEKQDVYSQLYGAGSEILDPAYEVTLNQVTGMLYLIRNKSETGSDNLGVKDLLDTIQYVSDTDPTVAIQDVRGEILGLVSNTDPLSLKLFFKETPLSVIQAIEREIEFTGSDLSKMLEDVGVDTFIEIAGEIGVEKTSQIIGAVVDFKEYKSEFISKVTELTTAKDVWSAIKNIYIDSVHIMKDKQFLWDGLVELFSHLPSLSVLKDLPDDQWKHNFHVVLDTAVEEVILDVNLGFKGDCKYLRKVAKVLENHVSIVQTGDHFDIEIDMPKVLANMYKYLCEAEFFDDDLKHEVWDLMFSTVDEAYQHVHQKTIQELKENAADIDYKVLAESIISADEIKEFFGIERFVTDERIDKFINLVFKAINKGANIDMDSVYELVNEFVELPSDLTDQIDRIYEKVAKLLKKIADRHYDADFIRDYLKTHTSEEINNKVNDKIDHYLENAKVNKYYNRFQRLLEKIYARVPQKFRNKSLMDYYRGDGVWSGTGSAHFDIKKIVRHIPKIGKKIADILSGFFDKFPEYASVSLTFTAEDLYRISYHVGSEVKTGALPYEVDDPGFFANRNTFVVDDNIRSIVGWAQKTGEQSYSYLSSMPKGDVDAYPIWFKESEDVSRPYSKDETTTISVTPYVDGAIANIDGYDPSYVWVKDGAIIDGAEGPSIEVKNHSESGVYYCIVDGVKLNEITIEINQVSVPLPTQTEEFVYDGAEHFYTTSFGVDDESTLLYKGSGETSASNAGDYTVTLELNDSENYYWEGENVYHWSIKQKVITIPELVWENQTTFTYDGQEHQVRLANEEEIAQIPGIEIKYGRDDKASAVGKYVTDVHIVPIDKTNTKVVGGTYSSQSWEITKATITIPSTIGLVKDEFQYDGFEHEVQYDVDALKEHLESIGIDPNAVTVSFKNVEGDTTKAINIGEYHVTVHFDYDHKCYYMDPAYNDKGFDWVITKRYIDISNVTWNYEGPFAFDELTHSVKVVGLPTGVKVEYSGDLSASQPGNYHTDARLYCESTNNALIKDGEVIDNPDGIVIKGCDWVISGGKPAPTTKEFYSKETNEAGTPLVWVSLSKGIKGYYELHAEEVDVSKYDFNSITETGSVEVVVCYDINFYNSESGEKANINVDAGGNIVDKNFNFTVRILVPDSYKEVELVLTYVNANGEVSRLEGTRDGNYMVFTTNHLSIYGLVQTHVAGSNVTPYVVVGVAGLLATQATASWILILLAKRKRRTVKD